MKMRIFKSLRLLKYQRKYIYYSMAYGLSSLIIPMGIQYLVNSLALSGIWFNTISFLVIISVGLLVTHIVKYSQVVIMETLQREIFVNELARWKDFKTLKYSYYYFEVPNLLKSFSKAYSHLIELALLLVFGLITIVLFHPVFIVVPIFIALMIYFLFRTFKPAIETSIAESNEKYQIFDDIADGIPISNEHVYSYLKARDDHFYFTRINVIKVSSITVLCQMLLLGFGSYLIQINQLSVGQLVSAEIIVAGIFISFIKLPQTLESVFDYETSQYKIEKAIKDHPNE